MNKNQYEEFHETKAHTSPEFPYNTYLCSIPQDFPTVSAHWHNEVELIVIKKGQGLVYVDLQPHEVKAGEVVFILPGQLHAIAQKGDASMEYENILFREELLGGSGQDICSSRYLQQLFSGMVNFTPHISRECAYYSEITGYIEKIDSLCSCRPVGYQLAVKGYLFQMCFVLINNNSVSSQKAGQKKSLEKVKLVLSYIRENYSRPITIPEIAAVCHYSQSHFMKFFKESMGMGFVRYLNDYRLGMAGQMLKENTDSILEIAQNAGFENLSYFNRMFKRKYGVTPGQYRKDENTHETLMTGSYADRNA